ncbi:hypothetical protein GDO81_023251 [Engystomops pustulosus]|uniref:Uncharacterized protein n=1 Tax=Engystomops pustulosus TaxID=76066 RepID=A0AAV6YW06_ENGPU|nr:hypothetical protein GDO81_023251 [Engystomops pustulosus]
MNKHLNKNNTCIVLMHLFSLIRYTKSKIQKPQVSFSDITKQETCPHYLLTHPQYSVPRIYRNDCTCDASVRQPCILCVLMLSTDLLYESTCCHYFPVVFLLT